MAYQNYLLSCNGSKLNNNYISLSSYSVTYSTIDLDSYRDANGVLHRTALTHKVGKIEFNTPYMKQKDVEALTQWLRNAIASNPTEKRTNVTFYNPELNAYTTQSMYVPDITFKIAENSPQGFIYEPVRIAFIGY